ncbi:glycoside hydrolase family 5 protein [Rhizobium sp. AG855]|uniref:glycoside hydrolase family 5 protein n=1 Tax=Rhizobium sp. AG855 TaxID=2183898 RepID=UPI000E719B8C|nr:glycoside hydrolase family 5 protein [Rhizobium sp. AG855]
MSIAGCLKPFPMRLRVNCAMHPCGGGRQEGRDYMNDVWRTALLALFMAGQLVDSVSAAEGTCLRGVNLAGAEFGPLPGTFGKDYIYPSVETVDYFASKGFNTVRLPFLWERLQPSLFGDFAPDEVKRLHETVLYMRNKGISVILDPHNYARYQGQLIGSPDVPSGAFVDFWQRLAQEFGQDPGVIFALMNEPHDISAVSWLGIANEAIAGIRTVSTRNLVMVPGTAWTGAHSWSADWYGGSNASVMAGVRDPANHFAYEFHQYFDEDFSGKKDSCLRSEEAVASIGKIANWLRANRAKGFLGEFGVTGDRSCIAAAAAMTEAVDANRDVMIGWAYWAGGDWWPKEEALNIQPVDGMDRPQLAGLSAALARPMPSSKCNIPDRSFGG